MQERVYARPRKKGARFRSYVHTHDRTPHGDDLLRSRASWRSRVRWDAKCRSCARASFACARARMSQIVQIDNSRARVKGSPVRSILCVRVCVFGSQNSTYIRTYVMCGARAPIAETIAHTQNTANTRSRSMRVCASSHIRVVRAHHAVVEYGARAGP